MKLVNVKSLVVLLLAIGCVSTSALAVYDNPCLPGWESQTGYTSQFWGLNAVESAEPSNPLSPDIYITNSYGTATARWSNHLSSMVSWAATSHGQNPSWANGFYGGMVNSAGGFFDLDASVSTSSISGSLLVYVQYDWYKYAGASITASIANASDITPTVYYDYQIGQSGSGNPWVRTTKVFQLDSNPENINIDFSGTGFVVWIDSFSITTAIGDAANLVPAQMPIPEPATLAILGLGG